MTKLHLSLWATFLVGTLLLASTPAAEPTFTLPESNLSGKGRVTLLAIDDHGLRDREILTLTLAKPEVRREPVLMPERGDPSAPDAMAAHFYGTVLHDQGKFRMWYYAVSHDKAAEEELKQGPVCYAERDDGIHWNVPEGYSTDTPRSTLASVRAASATSPWGSKASGTT